MYLCETSHWQTAALGPSLNHWVCSFALAPSYRKEHSWKMVFSIPALTAAQFLLEHTLQVSFYELTRGRRDVCSHFHRIEFRTATHFLKKNRGGLRHCAVVVLIWHGPSTSKLCAAHKSSPPFPWPRKWIEWKMPSLLPCKWQRVAIWFSTSPTHT